jgi:hypothetical protein
MLALCASGSSLADKSRPLIVARQAVVVGDSLDVPRSWKMKSFAVNLMVAFEMLWDLTSLSTAAHLILDCGVHAWTVAGGICGPCIGRSFLVETVVGG